MLINLNPPSNISKIALAPTDFGGSVKIMGKTIESKLGFKSATSCGLGSTL
jgi:hypothetical protein